jgi:hypothetical protein
MTAFGRKGNWLSGLPQNAVAIQGRLGKRTGCPPCQAKGMGSDKLDSHLSSVIQFKLQRSLGSSIHSLHSLALRSFRFGLVLFHRLLSYTE